MLDSPQRDDAGREQLLDEAMAKYVQLCDEGRAPDRESWLQRYPEIAEELSQFLADEALFQSMLGTPVMAPSQDSASTEEYVSVDPPLAETVAWRNQKRGDKEVSTQRGTVLAGRYGILDVKAGGMGRVFVAEDLQAESRSNNRIVLKTVLSLDDFRSKSGQRRGTESFSLEKNHNRLKQRFQREAEAWVRLGEHPNIVRAFGVIELEATPFLVMDYVDKGDLSSRIRSGHLSVAQALDFAIQFCRGMNFAFSDAAIVHRDIKPSNVLIGGSSEGDVIKIADFGLCRAYEVMDEYDSEALGPGTNVNLSLDGAGTIAYMAREQFFSLANADTRSDIFSFGVMFYEMLTGQRLFPTRDVHKQLILRDQPPAQIANLDVLLCGTREIVEKCLQFDPDLRYQSFSELLDSLEQLAGTSTDRKVAGKVSEASEEQFTAEVSSHLALGQHRKAIHRASIGLDSFPQSAPLWHHMGLAIARSREQQEIDALSCILKAVELDPDCADYWSNLGWQQFRQGQFIAGHQSAMRATELQVKHAEAWACLGRCEARRGNMDAAFDASRMAMELAPQNWRVQASMGELLSESKRHCEAIVPLRQSTELNAEAVGAWSELAWCLAICGRYRDARLSAKHALKIDPQQSNAFVALAWAAWEAERDFLTACSYLDEAFRLDDQNHRVCEIGRIIGWPKTADNRQDE